MIEAPRQRSVAAQVGFVLGVLCLGVACGAAFATRVRSPVPEPPVAREELERDARARTGGTGGAGDAGDLSPGADGRSVAVGGSDSTLRGSAYVPVAGAVNVQSSVAADTALVQEPAPEWISPVLSSTRAGMRPRTDDGLRERLEVDASAAHRSGDEGSGTLSDARALPAPPVRETVDEVGSVPASQAGEALLFGVSLGNETVLYEVGIPGTAGLPTSIRGRWAWVGTCVEVKVDISQLPGGRFGSVRGVGTSPVSDKFGWVVPRAGCRSASRRLGALRIVGAAPEVEGIPAMRGWLDAGQLPCPSGQACRWLLGVNDRGRAVGFLVRGGKDLWIPLGGSD